MIRLIAAALLLWISLMSPRAALAAEGTEVVVVLDNSLSMGTTYRWKQYRYTASDPERRAQLAALILEGLVRDTEDRLMVVPMHGDPVQAGSPDALRDMQLFDRTPFIAPLTAARSHLEASPRTDRLLVFLTDGMPTDYDHPDQGRALLGPDRDPMPFDVVLLALLPREMQGPLPEASMTFMRPLAPPGTEVVRVGRAQDLVGAMTDAWAGALGSKPVTGALSNGEARTFEVGRYVTEVIVAVAGDEPTGPFVAALTTADGEQAPKVSGDNGCATCQGPATHFSTWRLPHDPTRAEPITLRLDRGRGDVTYGVILRYDLAARLELPQQVIAGDPIPVRAFLDFRGERVNDESFFGQDGFTAVARLGDEEIPLTPDGEGWFEGEFPEASPSLIGKNARIELIFRNEWMEEHTLGRVPVSAPPRIDLTAPAIQLGSWRGRRTRVETCAETVLSGTRPDGVALTPRFEGIPSDVVASATPLGADGEPLSDGASDRWRVCVTSSGCCGASQSTDQTRVIFAPNNPLVQGDPPAAALQFEVLATGFLTCWWPWMLGLLLLLLLLFILIGLLRGHDFEPDTTVRVAGSERQLARATAVVLREQPGGRRGFYRNARVCLSATGEFVRRPTLAAVHLEAVRGGSRLHLRGPLERKDRRSRKMVPVTAEEALDGPQNGVVYRCGGLWLRFE